MWGFLIAIVIGLAIIGLIFWVTGQKSSPSTPSGQTGTSANTQTPAPAAASANTGHGGHSSSSSKKSIWSRIANFLVFILLLVVTVVMILWAIGFVSKTAHWLFDKPKYEWVQYDKITIELKSKYGDPVHFDVGSQLSFRNATVPYCVKNIMGPRSEKCAGKGEDLMRKMGNTPANEFMWFKSSDERDGQVEVIFWKLKLVKK